RGRQAGAPRDRRAREARQRSGVMPRATTRPALVAATFGAAAALSLTACGFHLEGHTRLPATLMTPYLETQDRQTDFVQRLQRALRAKGAQLAPQKEQASAVVSILKDSVGQRVLSVSNLNQPNEYELTYTVSFSVTAGGQELLPPQEISTTRSYSFDPHILLA